jgi:2-enoate reductase
MANAAGRPWFKREVDELVQWYRRQVIENRIPVKYYAQATAESIAAYGADVVVVATGSHPRKFHSPVSPTNVVMAIDAMIDRATMGTNLLMVGGACMV